MPIPSQDPTPRESDADSDLRPIDAHIMRALVGTTLDFEGIWNGYLHDYDDRAVRQAIRRLRAAGLIVTPYKRGFYKRADEQAADA